MNINEFLETYAHFQLKDKFYPSSADMLYVKNMSYKILSLYNEAKIKNITDYSHNLIAEQLLSLIDTNAYENPRCFIEFILMNYKKDLAILNIILDNDFKVQEND